MKEKIKKASAKASAKIKLAPNQLVNKVKQVIDNDVISKCVCVSGYFDPIHVGHLEYLRKAKELGNYLVVIVNNDEQAALKKGKSFMPCDERIEILRNIRCVDKVIKSIDNDRTVCKTLATMYPAPDIFCNGGDQTNETIPETDVCEMRGIELIDGLGDKIQSSSWLINGAKDIKNKKQENLELEDISQDKLEQEA